MKKLYLIGNWKMNPKTLSEAEKIDGDILRGLKKLKVRNLEIVVCPPFPYLKLKTYNLKPNLKLGAQNVYFEEGGAFTGEVSAPILKSIGCKYVLVGHSERRRYFNEDNALINKKLKVVLKNNLIPILAVGERSREDERSIHEANKQLLECLTGIKAQQAKKIIFMYEPVWAISGGDLKHKSADPNVILEMRLYMKKVLSKIYSKKFAETAVIIYGGSSNSKNIAAIINEAQMDGALPGVASLNVKEFLKMAEIMSSFASL